MWLHFPKTGYFKRYIRLIWLHPKLPLQSIPHMRTGHKSVLKQPPSLMSFIPLFAQSCDFTGRRSLGSFRSFFTARYHLRRPCALRFTCSRFSMWSPQTCNFFSWLMHAFMCARSWECFFFTSCHI
jgi:hypothetical protein